MGSSRPDIRSPENFPSDQPVTGGQRRTRPRRPSSGRRRALLLVGAVLLPALAWSGLQMFQASSAGHKAAQALLSAERDLRRRNPDAARAHLDAAEKGFRDVHSRVEALGPLLPVARVTPFVRIQIKGAERFADAALRLTSAGRRLTDTAGTLIDPPEERAPIAAVLEELKATQAALHAGIGDLDAAIAQVRSLDGYRLVGPLGSARNDLVERLPEAREQAESADRGLLALIAFAGGSGPRRYLVFSQNPDEVRPTGGYMGTYGVLTAGDGTLNLERYDDIATWTHPRPDAVVPPEAAGSPFRFHTELGGRSLANSNSLPDWPTVAKVATELWQKGGEQPVDGVLSLTPAFLARVIGVLGSVRVPGYDETVTAQNALERIDFYVHQLPDEEKEDATRREKRTVRQERKDFVAALAEQVMKRLLEAPPTKREPLAKAAADAFDARELLAWSKDDVVQKELVARRWDGTLPATVGDFFYSGEFEYAAKNGRALQRTFDHHVELRPDGSARVTTTVTIANTRPLERFNADSLSYITLYGPAGGKLVPGPDPPVADEPMLSGHPAVGWFKAAPPLGTATITVAWDAPAIANRLEDGKWYYGLVWMKVPDHTGDKVNLKVDLPEGWSWSGDPPPATINLDTDFAGLWALNRPSG